jgi:hypothetical protein
LNFSRSPCLRKFWSADERARDIAVLHEPVVRGSPAARASPRAAGLPESGTAITRSASTRLRHSSRPRPRATCRTWSFRRESGARSRCTEHASAPCGGRGARGDCNPSSSSVTSCPVYVAQEGGADDVERARLAGDAVATGSSAPIASGRVVRHGRRPPGPGHGDDRERPQPWEHVGDGVLDAIGGWVAIAAMIPSRRGAEADACSSSLVQLALMRLLLWPATAP